MLEQGMRNGGVYKATAELQPSAENCCSELVKWATLKLLATAVNSRQIHRLKNVHSRPIICKSDFIFGFYRFEIVYVPDF